MTKLILSKIAEIKDYTINSDSLWRAEINKMTTMINDLEDLVNENDFKSSVIESFQNFLITDGQLDIEDPEDAKRNIEIFANSL
jgi:hypothetical protein